MCRARAAGAAKANFEVTIHGQGAVIRLDTAPRVGSDVPA